MGRQNNSYCTRLLAIVLVSISFSTISYGAAVRRAVAVARPAVLPAKLGARSFSHTPVSPWYKRPAYDRVFKLRKPVPSALLGTGAGVVFAGATYAVGKSLDKNDAVLAEHFGRAGLVPAMLVAGAPGFVAYMGAVIIAQGYLESNVKKAS